MRIIIVLLTMLCVNKAQADCGKVKPAPSHNVGTFSAGELAGRHLGDLYAGYIGVRGIVPEKITVDASRQLDSLWRAKIACNPTSMVVRNLHFELLAHYRQTHTHQTPDQFISVAQKEITFVQKEMDWKQLGSLYKLSSNELALVKKLSLQIYGKDLVAYGMTEIMPSDDGDLNVQVLEFLVRNYGPEFVYSIPARFDHYASFGFFQFTSKAIFDDGAHIEGASQASQALKTGNLPGSVSMVQGPMEFRAAYLFAVHNIALLVKRLNKKQISRLRALASHHHDDLVQFIASAHNGPAFARTAAVRWINADMKYHYYMSVSNISVRQYAKKTKANLEALRSSQKLNGSLYGNRL